MFHDPDPLGGRSFRRKLLWAVVMVLVAVIVFAMISIHRRRVQAQEKPKVKVETNAVVTALPQHVKGASTHLELANRPKPPSPPDLSEKVSSLERELAAMRAERNHAPAAPPVTPVSTPAPAQKTPEKPDPDAQRRKQEALERQRARVQEERDARSSGFAPLRHDKADEKEKRSGLTPLRSKHMVFAGTVIPIVMKNALNSESPDTCVAEVAHDVYDGLTGEIVLIPYGATVNCTYSSAVFGQERLVPKANLLTLPNGDTLTLENLTIATASGQAGLDGEVDHHWGRIFASIPLSVLRAAPAATTAALGNDPASRLAGTVMQDATQQTTQAARQSLLTNPTIQVERAKRGVIILPTALELRPFQRNP
jgi:type IV secretory pathway VirB10-like protein